MGAPRADLGNRSDSESVTWITIRNVDCCGMDKIFRISGVGIRNELNGIENWLIERVEGIGFQVSSWEDVGLGGTAPRPPAGGGARC